MINKKNLLGKSPEELGAKDAIHVAIVSVRAAQAINPGQRCKLNGNREAVPDHKGYGVADPFRKSVILRGQNFWMLLAQDEIPNVQHHWEHPTIDFSAPTVEVKKNRTIQEVADFYKVSYEEVMEAANHVIEKDKSMVRKTPLTLEELEELQEKEGELNDLMYEFWSEWAEETNYEFENKGTACCPEYSYPDCPLFK